MGGGNNQKKSTERRDSSGFKQQQRKNSVGGIAIKKENSNHTSPTLNKILNPKAQQAAGAAILSAVTSPQSNLEPQPTGINGFNRGELVGFLNMRYSDALTAYQNTNLDSSMRPEKYEYKPPQTTNAWTKNNNGISSVWSQPPHLKQNNNNGNGNDSIGLMANGVDFLSELAKK